MFVRSLGSGIVLWAIKSGDKRNTNTEETAAIASKIFFAVCDGVISKWNLTQYTDGNSDYTYGNHLKIYSAEYLWTYSMARPGLNS